MYSQEVGSQIQVTFQSNRFGRIRARELLHGLPLFVQGADLKSLIGDTYIVEILRVTAANSSYVVEPVQLVKCSDGLQDFLRPYYYRHHGRIRTALAELQGITRQHGKLSHHYIEASVLQLRDRDLPRAYRLDVAKKAFGAIYQVCGNTDERLIKIGLWLVRDLISQGQHAKCYLYLGRIVSQIEAVHGVDHPSLVPILELLQQCNLALGIEKSRIKTSARILKIRSSSN